MSSDDSFVPNILLYVLHIAANVSRITPSMSILIIIALNFRVHQFSFDENSNIIGHEIRQGYAEELSQYLEADVCYIDPPYIKRQYAANYHILETLAREDEPEAVGESGLRPWRDQYSNFCSKIKIRNAFDIIIRNIHCNNIFISYSEDGLLPIDDLLTFFQQYGTVELNEIRYKRFRSNNSSKGLELKEYLVYLHKN